VLQLHCSNNSVMLWVNYRCIILGYWKQLWGVLHDLVLSVLREVMVGHIAYGRLHITEYVFPDVSGWNLWFSEYWESHFCQSWTMTLWSILNISNNSSFRQKTPRCSGRLCWLWRNLVPSDGELHASCRDWHCIHTSPSVYWTDVVAFRRTWKHLGARWITVVQSGKNIFGNAAGAPGNHSYYLSFNNFQNLCIQFVFSSMYLCIYIATYLHMVYLDWQHAVIESNSRCAWGWRSSELRDTLRGSDRASLAMQSDTKIEWTHRCTGRPWSSEFGDALGDRDWVNSEMHWEAVIERVWTCTWRPASSALRDALWAVIERFWRCTCSRQWSREIRGVLGGGLSRGGRWEARQVLRLYSSVG